MGRGNLLGRRNWLAVWRAMWLALWLGLAGGPALAGEFRSREQPLNVASTTVWGLRAISVCWEDPGFATEKAWVRQAVATTWEAASAMRFIGWRDGCDSSQKIRIRIADDRPKVTALGSRLANAGEHMLLNFRFARWGRGCAQVEHREQCIRSIAIHEFGHALGFAHEHNRVDGFCEQDRQGSEGDQIVGVWDLSSVMNYCTEIWQPVTLSATDIEGVQTFYGVPPARAVTLPAGSYRGSCTNAEASFELLVASCKAKSGRYYRTGLPNWRGCTAGIANLDGRLGCPSRQPPPPGSWRNSCADAVVQGRVLAASCKTAGGGWQRTQLADFAGCTSAISNQDGALQCTRGNPPAGSYRGSCRNISLAGTLLSAECRTGSGRTIASGIKRSDLCQGDIRNSRGQLTCRTPSPPPPGSYRASCADTFVDGDDLVAACRVGGNFQPTRLPGIARCTGGISNVDGKLACPI